MIIFLIKNKKLYFINLHDIYSFRNIYFFENMKQMVKKSVKFVKKSINKYITKNLYHFCLKFLG